MINNIVLMGRITHSLELKKTASDKAVVNFSIAVDRSYGKDKLTDFFDCVAWTSTAEFITKYFSKGDLIAIVGQMTTRDYTGKDGAKKKAYEVLINQVSFCGGKKDAAPSGAGVEVPNVEQYVTFEGSKDTEEELPF